MKKYVVFLLFLVHDGFAQTKLTLEECYQLAQQNFPMTRQRELVKSSSLLNISNLDKNYLPQIELNAQATYQSEVTGFPVKLPNIEVVPLSKDQYKATLDARQLIWDGGVISKQREVLKAASNVELQRVEVEVAKLKERVNQLYFNVLQVEENTKLINLLKSDLSARIKKIQAGIDNGTALKMNLQTLEAENLKADQRIIELKSLKLSSLRMLKILLNKDLDENTVFERPILKGADSGIGLKLNRPELTLFDLQKQQIDKQIKITELKNMPRIGAFATLGYGKPGLNFLKNEFAPYALGGVSFKWNLSDFYAKTLRNDLEVIKINAQIIDIQRDVFVQNTNIILEQQSEEVQKLNALIETDKKILDLRTKIKTTASVQLDNGISTANDYLIELNAETQAREQLALHELQLIQAYINLKTTNGY
jgi:outer membrane protein TolC